MNIWVKVSGLSLEVSPEDISMLKSTTELAEGKLSHLFGDLEQSRKSPPEVPSEVPTLEFLFWCDGASAVIFDSQGQPRVEFCLDRHTLVTADLTTHETHLSLLDIALRYFDNDASRWVRAPPNEMLHFPFFSSDALTPNAIFLLLRFLF